MVRTPFVGFSTVPYTSSTLHIAYRRTTRVITPIAILRDEFSTGHINAFQERSNASDDATRANAAHVESAHDPNASSLTPTTSPTFIVDDASNVRGIALIFLPSRTWHERSARHQPLWCVNHLQLDRKRPLNEPPIPYPAISSPHAESESSDGDQRHLASSCVAQHWYVALALVLTAIIKPTHPHQLESGCG